MGEIFDRFDVEPQKGADITIGALFPEIFVSERDEIICYLGICLNDDNIERRMSFMHPYYMQGQHSNDKKMPHHGFMGNKVVKAFMPRKHLDNERRRDSLLASRQRAKRYTCRRLLGIAPPEAHCQGDRGINAFIIAFSRKKPLCFFALPSHSP